jgi:molecular chaperone GrpE (heat shock protein)
MATVAPTTIFETVRDEVASLAQELERKAEKGSPRREFVNGLLRDLYVVQELAKAQPSRFDDLKFVEPFVEGFLAKLGAVPTFFADAAPRARAVSDKVRGLVGERAALEQAREIARPIFEPGFYGALHQDARAEIESARLKESMTATGPLRALGPAPADVLAVSRLASALALHHAHELSGSETNAESQVAKVLRELEGWLESRGASPVRPAAGSAPDPTSCRALAGTRGVAGAPRGTVAFVAGAGWSWEGKTIARSTVVLSAGTQAHVVGAVQALLAKADAQALRRALPNLKALEARVRRLFDDPASKTQERGAAVLDLVEALEPLKLLADPGALSPIVEAIARDFEDAPVHGSSFSIHLLVPVVGERPSQDTQPREVWSYDVPPGSIVEVAGLGMKLKGELIRKASAFVSKGPPPAGAVDEISQLLPDDEVGKAYRERLKRSRTRDDELARALAELIVEGRHADLANASARAMRAVLDSPPGDLSSVEGWTETHDFLEKHLDALVDDGQQGLQTAHRLLRPYLQSLTAGRGDEPRLRSIAESLTSVLGLYGEEVTQATRAFIFSELSKLRAGALADSSHARRLARSIAHGFRIVSTGDNPAGVKDLVTALGSAGIKVLPADGQRLGVCPDADWLFHRLELRYDDQERGKILGSFDPAVVVGQATETGSLALSLGKTPKTLELIRSGALAGSRLRPGLAKLEEKLVELDRLRLVAELAGDATADRVFAREVSKVVATLLREVGWSRNEADRESLGPLLAALREDWKIEVLPGYLSYRELRKLVETHGQEKVQVQIQEAATREVVLDKIGAIFRDEVLEPLKMVWKVGKAPPYVAELRKIDWFDAVLAGKAPPMKMSARVQEAILDFTSPDAGSVEALVRSLQTLVTWLAAEQPSRLEQLLATVKSAPGLELDFAPLPGKTYTREQILRLVEEQKTPGSLTVSVDATKADGTATNVPWIAVYREGHRLSDEPKAQFALQSASQAFDGFAKALEPLLKSPDVSPFVKEEMQTHRTRLALLPVGPKTQSVEVDAFKTLHGAHLIDPQYAMDAQSEVHRTGAYLVMNLQKTGQLKVDRFEGARLVKDLTAPEGGLVVKEELCAPGMPEVLAVDRPLVALQGKMLQPALVRKGLSSGEEDAVQLDRVLNEAAMKLASYAEGPGAIVDASLDEKGQTLLPRTIKRIEEVRQKMLDLHKAGKKAMPSKTSLRDLLMFIIDQIHRYDDALALIADRTHRGVYADRVFRDVVFRSAGPYLSQTQGISIDTAVVAGADVSVLTGRFKKETTGVKPKRVNNIIFSVVTPAFSQGGTCIRPATVRVGEY